jgi:hypothetical protein
MAPVEGMPAMRLRILRSLEEPLGSVVCNVDLWEPDEESRLLQAACLHVMAQPGYEETQAHLPPTER